MKITLKQYADAVSVSLTDCNDNSIVVYNVKLARISRMKKTGPDNILRNRIIELRNFFGKLPIAVVGTVNIAQELK